MKIKILLLLMMMSFIPAIVTAQLPESYHPYAYNFAYTWPAIIEPGATQIRLHFTKVETDSATRLKILDKDGNELTSYHDSWGFLKEDFWSDWYTGDTLKVRLETSGGGYSGGTWGFKIDQVENRTDMAPSTQLPESYHPYAYNFAYTWPAIIEPGATQIRLHFTKVETDSATRLKILDKDGNELTSYHDSWGFLKEDFWSDWYTGDTLKVRLETSKGGYSGGTWGFKIDQKETRTGMAPSDTTTLTTPAYKTSNPLATTISTPASTYVSQPSIDSDTSPPSISISKQIIDFNKNGQLEEGDKLVITYGANDESGVKSIKLLIDGNLIELRNNQGTYSATTDSLLMGNHSIVVEAEDTKGNKKSEEMKIYAERTGPSVYFPQSKYEVKEDQDFNVVLSAVNPIGNPKMKALLIIKPPGNGVSIYESWCKGLEGMCTGEFEIEPGDSIRSVSVRMRADQAGEYPINAEVYYQFDGRKSPTRYETLNLVVKPKSQQLNPANTQSPSTPGFEFLSGVLGLSVIILLKGYEKVQRR